MSGFPWSKMKKKDYIYNIWKERRIYNDLVKIVYGINQMLRRKTRTLKYYVCPLHIVKI